MSEDRKPHRYELGGADAYDANENRRTAFEELRAISEFLDAINSDTSVSQQRRETAIKRGLALVDMLSYEEPSEEAKPEEPGMFHIKAELKPVAYEGADMVQKILDQARDTYKLPSLVATS